MLVCVITQIHCHWQLPEHKYLKCNIVVYDALAQIYVINLTKKINVE